jgi:NADPH-dependent 2,4-dienoyl-CoA reductase/sulfur reductase-like enzyme
VSQPQPSSTSFDVIIVGGSVAGLSVAEALRRSGFSGSIAFVDGEPDPNYDRPPLSKAYLGGAKILEDIRLRPAASLDALGATWLSGVPAIGLDAETRTVTLADGRRVSGAHVVVATGLAPRTGLADGPRSHVLRTRTDADRLAAVLPGAGHVVVIGGGVLGSEIAATASEPSRTVTLVGSASHPMRRQLGPVGSVLLARMHREHGVRLRMPHRVVRAHPTESGVLVELDDGSQLDADHVVSAVGSVPNTDWLADSGLRTDDGILCDEYCQAAPGIWAAGDVARWTDRRSGEPLRLENRTNAVDQGIAVANNILGSRSPYTPVPAFWTDQYGVRIQVWGDVDSDDVELVEGSLSSGRFVAEARGRDGGLLGVLAWAMPKQGRLHAAELTAATVNRSGSA